MNIKQGKIRNINKKIIAGVLVFTLVTVPLVGCDGYESFEYTTNEQGQYIASGKIDYELLKNQYFLVIENSSYDVIEYYIASKMEHYPRYDSTYTTYTDVFSNQEVFSTKTNGNRKILVCNQLEDYLYATNNVKSSYTVEEVELMFSQLKSEYLKDEKVKIK